ncbi:hypothetical protein LB505_009381 [Fusarium chuoi]|nr:hypothetical protein LB505_009381 [Fusarium chuoi]
MLGNGLVNTGSVAFGGPPGWIALYRDLSVADRDGHILYENSVLEPDASRTLELINSPVSSMAPSETELPLVVMPSSPAGQLHTLPLTLRRGRELSSFCSVIRLRKGILATCVPSRLQSTMAQTTRRTMATTV